MFMWGQECRQSSPFLAVSSGAAGDSSGRHRTGKIRNAASRTPYHTESNGHLAGKQPAGVRPWLWQLVCMAAIAAMELGRRQVSRLQLGDSHHSSAAIISRAGNSAVARMWDLLAEAASGHKLPSKQAERRPQPFLRFDTTGGHWVPTV